LTLTMMVTNRSRHAWSQRDTGPIRLGNHWLAESGGAMLIQDDGRAVLPHVVDAGQTCRVILTVNVPPEPGEYLLECDLVHEGITWFHDRGSPTWRSGVRVPGAAAEQTRAGGQRAGEMSLALPDVSAIEPPGPLPMHGIHRDLVSRAVDENRGSIVHAELDERCGPEWIGYRYFVRKLSA
jgi:hypothetical protein